MATAAGMKSGGMSEREVRFALARPAAGGEEGPAVTQEDIKSAKVSAIAKQYFTGTAIKPLPTVRFGSKKLVKGTDYTLSYRNNKKPGKASITINGKGAYKGKTTVTFQIAKRANTVSATSAAKTLKASRVAKSKKTVKAIAVKKTQGPLSYARIAKGSSKCLTVSKSTGAVTVKKGTLPGTYKMKVAVKAAGNKFYSASVKTVTVTITVK